VILTLCLAQHDPATSDGLRYPRRCPGQHGNAAGPRPVFASLNCFPAGAEGRLAFSHGQAARVPAGLPEGVWRSEQPGSRAH
jgi:hypothetical protein